MQKDWSVATGNAYKTNAKQMILMISKGRLITIGGTKFEAKRLRAGLRARYNH